ncbi:hypothetical protein [Streptomyces sp. NPDC102282]|uniref:hypothetical protein n=1 Tax=Streptomyces sp. NPDC102282 TaxID=3366154 RepID=UPI003812FD28
MQISTDCWRASKEEDEQDKAAWLKAKRAEEQAESEAWSEQYLMPPLGGTERAVAWGVRCRHQVLAAAYTALVTEGEISEAEWEGIKESARAVTRAGWWIEQRSSQPDDLPELLRAATEADRPTGRPKTPTSDRPVPRLGPRCPLRGPASGGWRIRSHMTAADGALSGCHSHRPELEIGHQLK